MPDDIKKLAKLKAARDAAIKAAEKAAYNYWRTEGKDEPELLRAAEVYENVRTSLRTGT